MTTKPMSVGMNRGIYDGPYDAFTNYMNILGDFISRVNSLYPAEIENEELNSLLTTIKNQGEELESKEKELAKLKAKLAKLEKAVGKEETVAEKKKPAAKATKKAEEPKAEAKPKKAPAKKTTAKSK